MYKQYLNKVVIAFFVLVIFSIICLQLNSAYANPKVLMETSEGNITIELYEKEAPVTVKNFLSYVSEGFYNNLIFHRVIPNFMIQGGGFDSKMNQKPVKDPIKNEARRGLNNKRGTLAMARTNVINSATAQFFINLINNDFLDHKDNSASGFGYAVFGEVTEGMDVVDKIGKTRTHAFGMFRDVPINHITIKNVSVIE
ncbi:MAG: peptidylprolyl isomerase [Planctomycetota bacterium]